MDHCKLKAAPQDLAGVSLLLSTSVSYYSGIGFSGYWDVARNSSTGKHELQGFAITPFAGIGYGTLTFEAAGGISFSVI